MSLALIAKNGGTYAFVGGGVFLVGLRRLVPRLHLHQVLARKVECLFKARRHFRRKAGVAVEADLIRPDAPRP